ncbi:MAG: hypothetical protein HFJ51_02500 [Clostridia bacterium]|nr:hypothetical protein [Clostridia bacterium]
MNLEDNIGTIGSNLQRVAGRNFDYLALNTKSSLLSYKEARKAISYAIDKEEIINTVYSGKYIKANHPLEYGSYLYNKNSNYEYNQEKAKQILITSGWNYASRNLAKKRRL